MNEKKFRKQDIGLFCLALLIFISLMGVVFFQRDWVDDVVLSSLSDESVDFDYAELEEEFDEFDDREETEYSLSPDFKEVEGEEFEVDIVIDDYDEKTKGFNLVMSFDGNAEYSSFTEGEIENCDIQKVGSDQFEGETDLVMYCFLTLGEENFVLSPGDIFATLHFDVLEPGDFTISFRDFDNHEEYLYDGNDGEYILN